MYWHCTDCGATAQLPSSSLAACVRGLRQHQTIAGHVHHLRWVRQDTGLYVLKQGQRKLGTVEHVEGLWMASLEADVDTFKDALYPTKRAAKKDVERAARRLVTITV